MEGGQDGPGRQRLMGAAAVHRIAPLPPHSWGLHCCQTGTGQPVVIVRRVLVALWLALTPPPPPCDPPLEGPIPL